MAETERLPLIFDHHSHLSLISLLVSCPSVDHCTSESSLLQYLDRLSLSTDRLQLVTGLHSELFSLSAVTLRQLPPLVFLNRCLHGYTCTDKAAELLRGAGLDPTPISTRQAEKEMAKILTFFATCEKSWKTGELRERLKTRILQMQAIGLYGLEDMMCVFPLSTQSAQTDGFTIKKRFLLTDDHQLCHPSPSYPFPQAASERKQTDSILGTSLAELAKLSSRPSAEPEPPRLKLFADGALGAQTAALSGGYTHGWQPTLIYTDNELEEALQRCIALGADTAIHTIGDLAIAQVLRVLSRCLPLPPGNRFKLRLEHCQFITRQQAAKCKQLGITLSMQPNFNADSVAYASFLSKAWLQRNNPLRMLIDQIKFVPGQDLLFGSDDMPLGLAAALENTLFSAYPGQSLTIEELLAGYGADEEKGLKEYIIDRKHRKVHIKEH
ncbi:MAG: amidohydrolase family protein [Candidatus Bruticola sp.]